MALTAKQEMFVREYMIDLNATQAAIRAGYSLKSADKIGHQLLEKSVVKEAVIKASKGRAEKVDLDAAWVLARLKLISDTCSQVDENGKIVDAAGANKATELIGKHLVMFTDKVDNSGKLLFEIKRPDDA